MRLRYMAFVGSGWSLRWKEVHTTSFQAKHSRRRTQAKHERRRSQAPTNPGEEPTANEPSNTDEQDRRASEHRRRRTQLPISPNPDEPKRRFLHQTPTNLATSTAKHEEHADFFTRPRRSTNPGADFFTRPHEPSNIDGEARRTRFSGCEPFVNAAPTLRLRLRGSSLSSVSDKRLGHCCCSGSSSRTRVSMATKGEVKKEVFESEEDLAVSLAKYTAQLSDKFCKERGAFTVVLSGGSLINSLRKLVEPPYIDSIEWSKWHVFWLDERVVPKDHEDSNYKLAYDGLLSKVPILPGNVYAINDALSAEAAAEDYETRLRHLVKSNVLEISAASGFPKFDLQLLGMGPDGHVASLFPGHPLLKENKKWVTFIKDSPKPPPERITFTFPVINSSAYIALVVTGAAEAGAVQNALGNSQNSEKLPVAMVSPEGELAWFLDAAAASKL
nr:putative 6-phosphogluconolactonase 4, chloroplastic [Quercus suber]